MGKKEDYKKMLKDKSFVFTPENEVTPNELILIKIKILILVIIISHHVLINIYIIQITISFKKIN